MNNIHPESGPVLGPASPKALYTVSGRGVAELETASASDYSCY